MALPDNIPFHNDRLQVLLKWLRSPSPRHDDEMKWLELGRVATLTDAALEIAHVCERNQTLADALAVLIIKAERAMQAAGT